MNFLKYKDVALVTVSIGYDASATSIDLSSGHGNNLPSIFPYDLVWWNTTDYNDPTDDPNREIIRVTAKTSDTLTIIRSQQDTAATTKNTSGKTYKMAQLLTDGDWQDSLRYFDTPEKNTYFWDDFISAGLNNLTIQQAGANTNLFIPSEPNHPGILRITSGNTGSAAIKLTSSNSLCLNDCYLEFVVYLRTVAFANSVIFAGLDDSTAATNSNKTNGAYFISDPVTYANGNWRFLVRSAGSTTQTIDTGIAVTANKWYKLQIKAYEGGFADIFINDSLVGRATNLPLFPILMNFNVCAGDGSAAATVDIDGFELLISFNKTR